MEKNELQELFTAKRTVEANRRRQEQLTAMIGSHTPKARPAWPIWAASVAAGIAALLMIAPSVFRHKTTEKQLIAQAQDILPENIEINKENPNPTRKTSSTSPTINFSPTRKTSSTIPTSPTSPTRDSSPNRDPSPEPPTSPAVEKVQRTDTTLPIQQQPSPTPQKRVHRRTSTRMVSTGNAATNVKRSYLKAVADVICQEDRNTITLHTIDLS